MTGLLKNTGRSALLILIGFIGGCAITTLTLWMWNSISQNQDPNHITQLKDLENRNSQHQIEPVSPHTRQPNQNTIERVQRATVYIEVEDGRGSGGVGSGWFGIEPGMVITNAHVIMMQQTDSKPPAKMTLYINSGIVNQQIIVPHARIRILAVDTDMDLAILQVLGEPNLPEPLQIRDSAILRPLDQLTVFGFPGGKYLSLKNRNSEAPTVTINPTTMTRLVYNDYQNLYAVQLAGGIIHGNSGGPIIDADGNVVAVSARVDVDTLGRFTNIAYAVPTEYVRGLFAGRPASVEFGLAYYQKENIHIPVVVKCLDPMHRLESVGITYWVGDANSKIRVPGESHQVEPGDSHLKEILLTYEPKKSLAQGEIVVPKLPVGRAYMVQVNYRNALVKKYWLASEIVQLDRTPIERIPAELKVQYEIGNRRTITASRRVETLDMNESNLGSTSCTTKFDFVLQEIVSQHTKSKNAKYDISLRLESMELKSSVGMTKPLAQAPIASMSREYPRQEIHELQLSDTGKINARLRRKPNKLAPEYAVEWETCQILSDHVTSYVYIILPNREFRPGDTWEAKLRIAFPIVDVNPDPRIQKPGTADPTSISHHIVTMTSHAVYTYLGTRDRGGRKEAVLRMDGKYMREGDLTPIGSLSGMLQIDLQTGTMTEATIRNECHIQTTVSEMKQQSMIIEHLTITCSGS